jgi:hypothetical protein
MYHWQKGAETSAFEGTQWLLLQHKFFEINYSVPSLCMVVLRLVKEPTAPLCMYVCMCQSDQTLARN